MSRIPPLFEAIVLGLLLAAPLPLDWLAVQFPPILNSIEDAGLPVSSYLPLTHLLPWRPLRETALLLLAVASLAQINRRGRHCRADHAVTSTGIIGLSFLVSHLPQCGLAALAALPMALLLTGVAMHTMRQALLSGVVRHGLALFAIHSLYNAFVLAPGPEVTQIGTNPCRCCPPPPSCAQRLAACHAFGLAA